MKWLISSILLLLCACTPKTTGPFSAEITDSSGSNQLAMVYRRVWSLHDLLKRERSYKFDALVWRTNAGKSWNDRLEINAATFQYDRSRPFWVNQIHSLNPSTGHSIIQVGEYTAITNGASVSINPVYSWREWDLFNNKEVRVLQSCTNYAEKYNGTAIGAVKK